MGGPASCLNTVINVLVELTPAGKAGMLSH